ncbi:MAG: hypothetical protein R3F59_18160 [Myxococcota bacterium]
MVRWERGGGGAQRVDLPVAPDASPWLTDDGAELWIGAEGPDVRYLRRRAGARAFGGDRGFRLDGDVLVSGDQRTPLAAHLVSDRLWVSASGRTVAARIDGGLAWFDTATGAARPLALPPGLGWGSADQRVLVTDHDLVVWEDGGDGLVVSAHRRLPLALDGGRPLAVGGEWLAVARGGALELWTLDGAHPVASRTDGGAPLACAGFSADGARVVTGSVDGVLRLWALPDPPAAEARPGWVPLADGLPRDAAAVDVAVVGERIWVRTATGDAFAFDADSGEAVARWTRPVVAMAGGAALVVADDLGVHGVAADGSVAWTGGATRPPWAVQETPLGLVAEGTVLLRDGAEQPAVTSEALAEDGERAVLAGDGGLVVRTSRDVRLPGTAGARWAALEPGGERVAVGTATAVQVFDASTGRRLARRDARWVAGAWAGGRVVGVDGAQLEPVRWDPHRDTPAPSPYERRAEAPEACAVAPDGRWAAVSQGDTTYWYDAGAELLRTVPGRGPAFSAEGRLVVADGDHVAAWDAPETPAWRVLLRARDAVRIGESIVAGGVWLDRGGREIPPVLDGERLAVAADGSGALVSERGRQRIAPADGGATAPAAAPCADRYQRCGRAVSTGWDVAWTRPAGSGASSEVWAVARDSGIRHWLPLQLYGAGAVPVALAGDGLVVARGETVERWSRADAARTDVWTLGEAPACVAASADGRTVVAAGRGGALLVLRP